MRLQKARLVFRKDWLEIKRNWQVILPIIIVPLMISVFIPVILTLIPSVVSGSEADLGDFLPLIQNLPLPVQDQLAGMAEPQVLIYVMAVY